MTCFPSRSRDRCEGAAGNFALFATRFVFVGDPHSEPIDWVSPETVAAGTGILEATKATSAPQGAQSRRVDLNGNESLLSLVSSSQTMYTTGRASSDSHFLSHTRNRSLATATVSYTKLEESEDDDSSLQEDAFEPLHEATELPPYKPTRFTWPSSLFLNYVVASAVGLLLLLALGQIYLDESVCRSPLLDRNSGTFWRVDISLPSMFSGGTKDRWESWKLTSNRTRHHHLTATSQQLAPMQQSAATRPPRWSARSHLHHSVTL